MISYLISSWLHDHWSHLETEGFLNLGRLVLVTRYSYPEMLGHTLLGVAFGLWVGQNDTRTDLARAAGWNGAAVFAIGLMLSFRSDVIHWFDNDATVPAVITYCGASMMIFSVALSRAARGASTRIGQLTMRILVVIGLLALPAFVGHAGVRPLTKVLADTSLPAAVCIGGPVLLFVAGFLFAIRRVYRLYYGAGPDAAEQQIG